MKKTILVLIAGLLIITAIGCDKKDIKETSSVQVSSSSRNENSIDAFGFVKSKEVKDIVLDFPASIEKISVKEGQKVNKGDVIAELNIDDYNAQIKSKESELTLLKEKDGSTKGEKATAEALENEINVMKSKLNKSYIKDNKIICDVDKGIVYDFNCTLGDTIKPGVKILSVLNSNNIVIQANVSEEFIALVKDGAIADIIPAAAKGIKYTGKVTYISNKAVQKNGETTVPVEITLDKTDGLMPDFNVEVNISAGKVKK